MKIKNLAYSFLLICFFINANAQTVTIKNADKKYDDYAYADAIKLYEKMLEEATDPMEKKTIASIIEEEKVHAGEFLALLQKISPEESKLYLKGQYEVEGEKK